ncbi:TRAP transporter small permease [Paenalcaligenes niemegkensis]|uniref:TRAP transporter small permease n=1 Tax=Paenalcaligenes niemegkensis TaxID=2895469 RepID=UPI001EE7DBFF|nr:TRAP transporter small permease [Paenalcaligenes niemegkensis]MCQ9617696.1 TRAP transporter small permease [Paenalcaligenes niemegkensis]
MNAMTSSADIKQKCKLLQGLEIINAVARWISRVSLLVMTVIIGWQVFARYVLNDSPSWSESTSVLLMGWFVLVGAGAGVRHRDHLGFVVGLILMPPKLRRWISAFGHLLVAIFGFGMAFFGMDLVIGTWNVIMPGSFLPQGAHYFPLIVGGVLIFIFSLEKLVEELQNKEENISWNN